MDLYPAITNIGWDHQIQLIRTLLLNHYTAVPQLGGAPTPVFLAHWTAETLIQHCHNYWIEQIVPLYTEYYLDDNDRTCTYHEVENGPELHAPDIAGIRAVVTQIHFHNNVNETIQATANNYANIRENWYGIYQRFLDDNCRSQSTTPTYEQSRHNIFRDPVLAECALRRARLIPVYRMLATWKCAVVQNNQCPAVHIPVMRHINYHQSHAWYHLAPTTHTCCNLGVDHQQCYVRAGTGWANIVDHAAPFHVFKCELLYHSCHHGSIVCKTHNNDVITNPHLLIHLH